MFRMRSIASPRGLFAAALLAAAVVALAVAWQPWRQRWLAEAWRHQIATSSDQQAAEAVRGAPALGDAAIPLLVEAVGSDRTAVALAAQETLLGEIERWETLEPASVAPKLLMLSSSLAKSIEGYGPRARRLARSLAERLLHWPRDRAAVDRTQFLADCHQVLRAYAAQPPAQADWQLVAGSKPATGVTPPRQAFADVGEELLEISTLPGGTLPLKSLNVRRIPGSADPGWRASKKQVPTAKVPSAPAREPLPLASPPDDPRALSHPTPGRVNQAPGAKRLGRPGSSPRRRRREARATPYRRLSQGADEQDFQQLDAPEVMRLLHARNRDIASAAASELARRGFRPRELALAEALGNPDPQARLDLVDELSRVRELDTRRWLFWLGNDSEADVRLAALTVLASSRSPELLKHVEQQARQDADARILGLAEQIQRTRSRPR